MNTQISTYKKEKKGGMTYLLGSTDNTTRIEPGSIILSRMDLNQGVLREHPD